MSQTGRAGACGWPLNEETRTRDCSARISGADLASGNDLRGGWDKLTLVKSSIPQVDYAVDRRIFGRHICKRGRVRNHRAALQSEGGTLFWGNCVRITIRRELVDQMMKVRTPQQGNS
jgi:hypothetical protein